MYKLSRLYIIFTFIRNYLISNYISQFKKLIAVMQTNRWK
ncbi:hypothetical protein AC72_4841 [Escherichia coli 2-316-03_S4_C1]|nr:hypothetical protein ECSTECB2F1_1098 [Escherichia coli O91:H21 str. B2F1]KDY07447.1 hypothetical protein AC72_4841 [Escherichia coli 2-316-03_S4_C1]